MSCAIRRETLVDRIRCRYLVVFSKQQTTIDDAQKLLEKFRSALLITREQYHALVKLFTIEPRHLTIEELTDAFNSLTCLLTVQAKAGAA